MNIQDCIEFTKVSPICYLATTEKDQAPMFGHWDSGLPTKPDFYFQIGANKEMYGQLQQNPKTEVCFYKHEGMIGTMLRVAGEVEFLEDHALKEKAMIDRPFLKDMGLTADSPGLVIFRIAHGVAHIWTMENNFKPKEIHQILIGIRIMRGIAILILFMLAFFQCKNANLMR